MLVGTGIFEELGWRAFNKIGVPDTEVREFGRELLILAERGVLSVEDWLSVLFLSPGVEVFLGTPDPNPMGVGLRVLEPDLMLEVLRTPEPLLPSSSELSDMLEPCLLGGREPGLEPGWELGVRELRPPCAEEVRREKLTESSWYWPP